jgi:hypothetical protein
MNDLHLTVSNDTGIGYCLVERVDELQDIELKRDRRGYRCVTSSAWEVGFALLYADALCLVCVAAAPIQQSNPTQSNSTLGRLESPAYTALL